MNVLSENNRPEEVVSVAETGVRPGSAGTWVLILLSASVSGCTCWPSSELTSSGKTHSIWRLPELKNDCSSLASLGSTITPPAQYGLLTGPWRSAATMAASMFQNDEVGSTGVTIPVTRTVIGVATPVDESSGPVIMNVEPACRPNVAAVCL